MMLKTHKTKNRRAIQLLLLFFLFFTCTIYATTFQTFKDSLKNKGKYNLDDPRNPNCPCHKQQKLAEEEYRKLIAQHKIKPAANNVADQNIVKIKIYSKRHRSSLFLFTKQSHKNKPKKNHKLIRDITACFHWR